MGGGRVGVGGEEWGGVGRGGAMGLSCLYREDRPIPLLGTTAFERNLEALGC